MRIDLGVSASACPQRHKSQEETKWFPLDETCVGDHRTQSSDRCVSGTLESHPDVTLRGWDMKHAYLTEEADVITDRLFQTEVEQQAFLINCLLSVSSHRPGSPDRGAMRSWVRWVCRGR